MQSLIGFTDAPKQASSSSHVFARHACAASRTFGYAKIAGLQSSPFTPAAGQLSTFARQSFVYASAAPQLTALPASATQSSSLRHAGAE